MGTHVTFPDPTLVASRRAVGRDGAVGAHLVIATPAPLDEVVVLLTEAHGRPARSGPDRWVWRWTDETGARRIVVATAPGGPLGVDHDRRAVPADAGTLVAVGRRVRPTAAQAVAAERRRRTWRHPRRQAA